MFQLLAQVTAYAFFLVYNIHRQHGTIKLYMKIIVKILSILELNVHGYYSSYKSRSSGNFFLLKPIFTTTNREDIAHPYCEKVTCNLVKYKLEHIQTKLKMNN